MALFGKRDDKDKEKDITGGDGADIPATDESAKPESPAPLESAQGYQTPDNFDFNRYFLAERRIVLDNINYETLRHVGGQLKMNVKDLIVAQVMGQTGVKVTYNRMLSFEPEALFRLSVTFGVLLVFNPGTRDEVDWHKIDVAAEFKKNCPQLIDIMASKATLLIAEITGSASGNPIILRK